MAYDHSTEQQEEEEYIDIDIDIRCSTSHYQLNKVSSPPNPREFEFPMSFNNTPHIDPVSLASPADELFYKGTLLPLHLPPRLQLVQKLLLETTNQTTTTTPSHSCTISPATSCYVSGELNPDDYLHDIIDFSPSLTHHRQNKSWSKKFNSKLKASRAYIKSLFIKAKASSINGFINSEKKSLYSVAHGEEDCTPRRSFSHLCVHQTKPEEQVFFFFFDIFIIIIIFFVIFIDVIYFRNAWVWITRRANAEEQQCALRG